MMDPKDFDALAFKYFAAGLTPQELEEFRATLVAHPELRRRFLQESIRVGTMHEWAAEQLVVAPKVRPVARWYAAAAAAAVIVAGMLIAVLSQRTDPPPIVVAPRYTPVPPPVVAPLPEKPVVAVPEPPAPVPPGPVESPTRPREVPPVVKPTAKPPEPPPPTPVPPPEPKPAPPPAEPPRTEVMIAAFEDLHGTVFLVTPGKGEVKAKSGAGIPAGSAVRVTGVDGVAVLAFPDGTRVALGSDSEIGDLRQANGKQMTLVRGAAALDVTPQPRDLPLRVQTAHGTVTVVGTSFTLRADANRLRVEVDEGRVRLENPEGRSVVVGKDQLVESGDGPELNVKRLAPPDLVSELVGFWRFEETGGDVAHDASPHRHHAAVDGPMRVRGKSGVALKFDGVDDFVRPPKSPILDELQEGDYTVAAWVQPEEVPRNGRFIVFGKVGFHIGLFLDSRFEMSHYLSAGPDGGMAHARSGAGAVAGEWVHLSGVVAPSKGLTQIFVNGRLEGQNRWTAGTTTRDYGGRGWTIGMAREAFASHHPFAGVIDEMRLYRRALTPRDIASLAGVPYAAVSRIR